MAKVALDDKVKRLKRLKKLGLPTDAVRRKRFEDAETVRIASLIPR